MKPPRDVSSRRFDLANNMMPFLDSQEEALYSSGGWGGGRQPGPARRAGTRHPHGHPLDNSAIRRMENVHKIVFVLVNAETEIDDKWDQIRNCPSLWRHARFVFFHSHRTVQHGDRGAPDRELPPLGRGDPKRPVRLTNHLYGAGFLWRHRILPGSSQVRGTGGRGRTHCLETASHLIRAQARGSGSSSGCRPTHPGKLKGIPAVDSGPPVRPEISLAKFAPC